MNGSSSSQVLGVRKVFGGSSGTGGPNSSGSSMDEEFEVSFVDHMWNSHGKSEVSSSAAFKSYCTAKTHIPISKTTWSGFGAFLQHLQQSGKCRLRQDPSQPGFLVTMCEIGGKRKAEDDRLLDEQIQRATKSLKKHSAAARLVARPGALQKSEKISFSLPAGGLSSRKPTQLTASVALFQADAPPAVENPPSIRSSPTPRVIQEMMQQREAEKIVDLVEGYRSRRWVDVGLIVRLASKPSSRGLVRFAREEGVVEDVHKDGLRARVRLLKLGKKLSVDQADLRTVVPEKGEVVRIVNGGFKGMDASIAAKDLEKQTADVVLAVGEFRGKSIAAEFQGKAIAGISFSDMCLRDVEVVVTPWRLRHHR